MCWDSTSFWQNTRHFSGVGISAEMSGLDAFPPSGLERAEVVTHLGRSKTRGEPKSLHIWDVRGLGGGYVGVHCTRHACVCVPSEQM